jgi:hypothetical protein
MKNELANDPSHERYVVEIDGIAKSEYRVFVKALTAGLQLKPKSFRTAALNCAGHMRKRHRVPIKRHASPLPKLCRLIAISRESGRLRA